MQYFAQDEANRLEPTKTVYETMESDSPVGMVPMIRNILGGFLFTGDDIYKKAGVLSGGERTRLAVARMLLRPANTLLLDEPTNHLDLDSKDVLLEALEDFGGTLIFVSHDRYFVDRLATKIIAVGHAAIEVYPGTYEQFLWSRTVREARQTPSSPRPRQAAPQPAKPAARHGNQPTPTTASQPNQGSGAPVATETSPPRSFEEKKRADAEARRLKKEADSRARRVADLEARIADREREIRELEQTMSTPGFYEVRETAEKAAKRHQELMWEVGDLMHQWESLQ
jgi:ATP-binding cassette subfamily F protein 3